MNVFPDTFGTTASIAEIFIILFLFLFFLVWMFVKAKIEDEDNEVLEKIGKRKRLRRKVNLMKAKTTLMVRKITKGDKK